MPLKSRYCVIVDNLSSVTRSADIKYEMERWGPVLAVERDPRFRCAIVEYKSSRDADDAWRKADGLRIDGREWRIEWANEKDFRHFGWRWTEGRGRSPSPVKKRGRSPSPSRSRSRSRSESPGHKSKEQGSKEDSARER